MDVAGMAFGESTNYTCVDTVYGDVAVSVTNLDQLGEATKW